MVVTVDELLCKQFNNRSLDEKVKIITEGKPRPVLCKCITFNGNDIPINEFYDQEAWLTGCELRNAIYCWTCLLFPYEGLQYRSFLTDINGVNDKNLYSTVVEHKKTTSHKSGLVQLQLFLNRNSLSRVNQKNVSVKRNYEILKQITDVVCLLVPQALAVIKSSSNCDCPAFKLEDCIQILTLIRSYGNLNATDEAIKFIKIHPSVLMDTVEAVANVMRSAIIKEIQSTSNVSLILSQHSETDTKSKLSAVLRYISKGSVCERFIEFIDFNVSKDTSTIQHYISKLISEFEISHKFLALSCDGSVLPNNHLINLIPAFSSQYPLYFFAPCYFHDFNYVLEQSLSGIPECQLFFKNLKAMKTFFQNNTEMCDTFNSVTKGEIPDIINFKLSNSQFLRVLKLYRRQFAGFFWYIIKDFDKWNKDDIVKAIGFKKILEEYQTIFLLEAFFLLFDRVAILSEMLSTHSPENVFDENILNDVKMILMNEKAGGFEKLWTLVITEIIEGCKPETLQATGENETKHLLEVYAKVIDCMIEEITARFSYADRLGFLSVFNCETNSKFVISDCQMKMLQELQIPLLNKKQLETELDVLYKNGSVFGGKSVHELIDFLVKADLHDAFENVYKLTEIILTLPCKPATFKNSGSSKFDLINAWASISSKTEMNFLSLLCIENEFLENLKSRSDFYSKVIAELKKLSSAVQSVF